MKDPAAQTIRISYPISGFSPIAASADEEVTGKLMMESDYGEQRKLSSIKETYDGKVIQCGPCFGTR